MNQHSTPISDGSARPIPTPRHRLLLVDDEEIVLVSLRETLRREGYEIVTAGNALLGLEALQQGGFAAVLTDQQMPFMTGLEFLAKVKQIQPNATRILITAVLSLETVVDAINQGEIYRFIIKPWLREELLATVKNAVQRYDLLCRHAELEARTQGANQQLAEANHALLEQIARLQQEQKQLAAGADRLEASLDQAVRLCLRVAEVPYPHLGAHARRVHEICLLLAESLALGPRERQVLEMSAWAHDLGLIGLPPELRERARVNPAGLKESERALLEEHPVRSQELLPREEPFATVGTIVRAHHERYDGTGYPDRLAAENIPWLGRVLALAAHFAEEAGGLAETLESIRQGSGRAFDPEAVRALLRIVPKMKPRPQEREVLLSELRPGMVLARGIYTAEGALLAPEGQPLSAPAIDHLLKHDRVQPIRTSLVVYC